MAPRDGKIRVLFLYPARFYGPVMTVFSHIVRHLDPTRFEPHVVLNTEVEGEYPLQGVEHAVVKRFPFKEAGIAGNLGLAWQLARYARREGIDIVHCPEGAGSAPLAWFAARHSGARLLVNYHSLPKQYTGTRRRLVDFVSSRADLAVTVSDFVARHVQAARHVEFVLNGANVERFHPGIDGSGIRREFGIADDEVLALHLGRILQWKRQEDTVRAFALARRQAPHLRCLVVGWDDPNYDGPFPSYKAELEHIAAQEHLGDRLIFADARPDAPQLMAAADFVIVPSIDDPCPLVVTEAMATGRPVIGAIAGGIPETIEDGVTGYLVPACTPEALGERMVQLAQDPALRQRIGQAARHRTETYFNEARVAAEFSTLYEALAQGGLPRPLERRGYRSQPASVGVVPSG